METKFYDRKQELNILNSKYSSLKSGEMLVFYGRRRVGKTELIKQFIKNVNDNKLYFYVDLLEKQGILNSLSKAIQEQLNETMRFLEFSDFFDYIFSKSENKFVLIFDEFQRFLEIAPEFITQLQNQWDSKLKNNPLMIILVGSSIGMMHKITDSKTGALYGRATKIKISPFKYADFRLMFKELNEEEKVILYSVFGGTPYYLEKAKKIRGDIHKKIEILLLQKGAELFEEPKNFLEYENVRIHAKYNSLLQASSSGKENLKEMQDFTGITANVMPAYITRLDELLDLLSRKDPILGKERLRRYIISDNFFRFWYKFIFPNQTSLNMGNHVIAEDFIKLNLNSYVGKIFEDVCKELIIINLNKSIYNYTFDFEDIGTWWNRSGEEIDIVAYNSKSRKILLCEVKWKNELLDVDIINDLLRKSKFVNFTGEYKFMFISKSGFTEKAIERMKEINAIKLDLKDLEKMFDIVN